MKDNLTNQYIKERIASVKWWHPFTFRGYKVPSATKGWKLRYIPKSYKDKTVLDIGCKDGLFSFDAEDKGAKRVLMLDHKMWQALGIALDLLETNNEFIKMNVYDLDHLKETFDTVIFMGVLYHLKYPLYGLQKVADKTKDLLILESHIILNDNPMMKFYETDELLGDFTNWWGPSVPCLYGMLRTVGFKKIKTLAVNGDRIFINAWKN